MSIKPSRNISITFIEGYDIDTKGAWLQSNVSTSINQHCTSKIIGIFLSLTKKKKKTPSLKTTPASSQDELLEGEKNAKL